MSELIGYFKFQKIWIYSESIDFRKQVNGLIDVILGTLEKTPNDGSLYIFRNRQSNRIKLLFWDRNGYFLGMKRLEKGRFSFPVIKGIIELNKDELSGIISGMPMVHFSSIKKPLFHH
jgi:transposase